MKNYQKKKDFRYLMQTKPMLILLFVLMVFFIWSVISFIGKRQETYKNKRIAEEKIENLKQQKDKLYSDILKLKTEKGMEENIRNKFGFAREGEGVIVVVEDENKNEIKKESKSETFLNFFKNLFN